MPTVSAVALDGPVASGKTVVGRRVAGALGFRFFDTGLLYRAVAWAALRRSVSLEDPDALTRLAATMRLEVAGPVGIDRVVVDGEDATEALRESPVERAVSRVAAVAGVREALVKTQRSIAAGGGVIMAGRDIGTVILPDADLKVFLQASVDERARRRHAEQDSAARPVSLSAVRSEIEQRDRTDSERTLAPLRQAPDAHLVETDGVALDDVVDRVLALVAAYEKHG